MKAVLVYKNGEDAPERLGLLQTAGWQARHWTLVTPAVLREWAQDVPDAILIDMEHRPSHGKEVAQACRERKALRGVPVVFLDGQAEKLAPVRAQFPEAVFGSWRRLRGTLREAVAMQGKISLAPPVHSPNNSPLAKKLGIAAGALVLALDAPDGLEATLGSLPDGARLELDSNGPAAVVIQFVRSRQDLIDSLPQAIRASGAKGRLWLAFPKKTGGLETDLTQQFLREYALTRSLVDYKVCAIDATWTGFCFSRRKA